jgi:hypothetical protein
MSTIINDFNFETYHLEKINQILNKLKITMIVIMLLYSLYLYYKLKKCYNYIINF